MLSPLLTTVLPPPSHHAMHHSRPLAPNENVQSRTAGVLERITDSVTNHCALVGFAALSVLRTKALGLNKLLRVVPCATSIGHSHSQQKASRDGANQKPRKTSHT